MKNVLIFSLLFALAGCTTVPVKQKFPEAPEVLMQKCPDLDIIDKPTVLLSELILTITRNYMKYHECSNNTNGWIDWYTKNKQVYDQLNK